MVLSRQDQYEASIASAVFQCISGKKGRARFAYTSGPISSGKRAYDVFDEHDVKTRSELEEKLGEKAHIQLIIKPNIAELRGFAGKVSKRTEYPVVNPGDFYVGGWSGNELKFMAIWEPFIRNNVDELHFTEAWNYSTGAVAEFLIGVETDTGNRKIELLDHTGNIIFPEQGLEMVAEAVSEVRQRSYQVELLENSYRKLKEKIRQHTHGP